MTWVTVIGFLKAILPTKRIAAWILGLLAAVLALFMGVNTAELKAQFCASDPVTLPQLPAPVAQPTPAPVVAPQPAAK